MTDLTGRQILDAIARGLEESGRRFEAAEPDLAVKPRSDARSTRTKPDKESRAARRA